MLFSDFKLKPTVLESLDKMGYKEPTKIQEEVIKAALEGKNIVGQSQTGTGKTAAFVIPLLELIDSNVRKPQALIVAPTRELAMQIREEFVKLSEGMFMRSVAVYGGSPIRLQREVLDKGPQIVVATPGRLIDLIDRRYLDISEVKYFILDEVDRMLDMGFVDDIDYVWSKLTNIKQSMTFSATIPQEVKNLLAKYVGEGYESIKSTDGLMVSKIDHSFIEVPHFEKYEMLKKYIAQHKDQKVVVFARMKHETEELADKLADEGYSTGCLHGDMQQRDRARSLRAFQEGRCSIFVTTDVAARGLNMKDIELVVNYHVPEDPEAYIHRIGRTGRAGATGKAIMFVSNQERHYLQNIERRNKITLKQVDINGVEVARAAAGNGGHHRAGSRKTFGGGGSYGRSGGGRSSGGYQGSRSSGGGYGERSSGGSSYAGRSSGGYQGSRDSGSSYAPRSSGGYEGRSSSGGSYGSSSGGYQGSRDRSSSDAPRNSYSRPEGGAPADRPSRDFPKRRDENAGGYGAYNKAPHREDRGDSRPSKDFPRRKSEG